MPFTLIKGTFRLRGSRVTLDTFVTAYKRGETVEQIHEGFPSLSLEKIQKAIDWYLANQDHADNYLNDRFVEGEELRRHIQSRPEYTAFREMLRERTE